ncbi:MAG: hypothetical protein QOD77_873 [Thermoplasmata archaeon]|jgi:hypothetical protein|nr:hypothetical protein [Thermoplasmata archaeon]
MARAAQAKARPQQGTPRSARPRRPLAGDDASEVQAFLDGFAAAVTAGDGKAAAACFDYPALMVMGDATQPLEEPEAVAAFFAQAPEQYHAKGIEDTRADIQDVEWLNDRLVLVRTHFPYLDAAGADTGDGETSLYLMRRRKDGSLGLCVAVPLGTDSGRDAP